VTNKTTIEIKEWVENSGGLMLSETEILYGRNICPRSSAGCDYKYKCAKRSSK
jgi:hypothetical protein